MLCNWLSQDLDVLRQVLGVANFVQEGCLAATNVSVTNDEGRAYALADIGPLGSGNVRTPVTCSQCLCPLLVKTPALLSLS